jgi:hypothetical protein
VPLDHLPRGVPEQDVDGGLASGTGALVLHVHLHVQRVAPERDAAVAWVLANPQPIALGPCDYKR